MDYFYQQAVQKSQNRRFRNTLQKEKLNWRSRVYLVSKILPPTMTVKRKPVAQHEMIVRETKINFWAGNALLAYILKDTITVITIQGFPY